MFCPKAGPSLQAEKPRLQFCPKAGPFHLNSGTKVAVLLGMNRCGSIPLLFPRPILSLVSEQTFKDLKRAQGHKRGGEESGFG